MSPTRYFVPQLVACGPPMVSDDVVVPAYAKTDVAPIAGCHVTIGRCGARSTCMSTFAEPVSELMKLEKVMLCQPPSHRLYLMAAHVTTGACSSVAPSQGR